MKKLPKPPRVNWIGAPQFFNLNHACRILTEAYGYHVYLVGSAMERRDFRDVDIRCILDDDEFARLFPDCPRNPQWNARWSLLCSAISEWLSTHSSLPVDFQFQSQTAANRDFGDRPRSALGFFVSPPDRGV